jgi:uncharacterized repeat protein (TIGR01451 family)
LAITQTIAPNPVTISNQVTLTLTASNQGPNDTSGAIIVDSLPTGLTFVSATPAPNAVSGQLVSFNTGPVPNGGSATVVIQALPVAAGTLANIASVSGPNIDDNVTNNQSQIEFLVNATPVPQADLMVTVGASTYEAFVGSNFTVTATVTNFGPSAATNTVLSEAIPNGLSLVSAGSSIGTVTTNGGILQASIGTLANGAGATVTFTATPTIGRPLVIVATAASANNDPVPTNNIASVAVLGWNPLANVAIVQNFPDKEIDALQSYLLEMNLQSQVFNNLAAMPTTINFTGIDMAAVASVSGQNFTYTIGSGPATGTVNVRQITGTPSSLLTGSTPDVTGFYAEETGDDLSPMVYRFTFDTSRNFTITQNEYLANLEINSFTLPSGSWTVLSTADATTTGSGSNISFVGVNGAPPYGTYSIAGSGASFDFAITNLAGYSLYGSAISVQVGFDFPGYGLVIYDDLIYAANGINDNDVDVFKAAYDAGTRLYFIGDDLAYSTDYALNGAETNTWVDLIHLNATEDNGGNGATMDIVDTNSPVTDGVFGLVTNSTYAGDPDGTTVTGTGEILLGTSGADDVLLSYEDPVTHNRTVTQNECAYDYNDAAGVVQKEILFKNAVTWLLGYTNVPPLVAPAADLFVTVSNSPTSVSADDDVVYTVTVANAGPDAASGVMLTDSLPTNAIFVLAQLSQGWWAINNNILTANLGSIVSNGTATLSLHLTAGPQGVLTNTVSVLGIEQDPNTNNNTAVSLLTVQPIGSPGSVPKADLSVSQTAVSSISLGQLLTYNLTVSNAGPYSASNVTLNDSLPAGASFVGALSSQGTVTGSSGTVNAALGTLASGASATLSIVASLTDIGSNTNSAIVASDAIDPNPGNNASSWITAVSKLPGTALLVDARTSQSSVPVGANAMLTFLVVNNGPDDSTGINLTVPLPAGMSFVSATGGITPVSGALNFALGPLAVGSITSANATLTGTVPGNAVSVATATSIEGGSNSASVTVSVFQPTQPLVDLSITSSVNDTYVPPGGSLVYTIIVANNSPTVATGVVLTNKLPASALFVSATSSSGTVTQTNGLVIANLGSVTSNAPITLTITATPSQPDVLINRAAVSSTGADANPGDNVSYVLALSEVVITSVDQVGTDLRLTFETSLGKNYVVQTKSDWTEEKWVDVPGSNSTGTGYILPVTISNPFAQPHQFYRVVLTP